MRRVWRLLGWAAVPVLAYAALAALGALVPRGDATDPGGPTTREIILLAGPIHYDILLPLDPASRAAFDFAERAGVPLSDPLAEWLSVGWGSEAFYTTAGSYTDIRAGAVWRAVTGDAAVIRLEVFGALPVHPDLRRIAVSDAQLTALRDAILADLRPEPRTLPLQGFSPSDAFFAASGHFTILRTCNVWVGNTLAEAGIDMGRWTPTPYAVTLSLWWNGHLDRPQD